MALLKMVQPAAAEGKIKEVYSFFEQMKAEVPLPLKLMSASPDLLSLQSRIMNHFMTHPALSFGLLAHIRMLVARDENYPYCLEMNRNLLQMIGGLTPEQVSAAQADPDNAVLPPKEKALLLFVLKVVGDPALSTSKDMEELHGLGWTDRDIFDAVFHGVMMTVNGMLFKIFKAGEAD